MIRNTFIIRTFIVARRLALRKYVKPSIIYSDN
ncbi:hypothetical protein LYSIN_01109 [Lysinibacillus sphaericus]|uniref:Uncharacterized protein n=1 Tax=Lysinibacillus sphaericus TaxID=1421 RepID=A0A2S5CZU4_LYSSH|nr:hypothetical protein LYSIN_01109 [Lysinibacillus sphaericus]